MRLSSFLAEANKSLERCALLSTSSLTLEDAFIRRARRTLFSLTITSTRLRGYCEGPPVSGYGVSVSVCGCLAVPYGIQPHTHTAQTYQPLPADSDDSRSGRTKSVRPPVTFAVRSTAPPTTTGPCGDVAARYDVVCRGNEHITSFLPPLS